MTAPAIHHPPLASALLGRAIAVRPIIAADATAISFRFMMMPRFYQSLLGCHRRAFGTLIWLNSACRGPGALQISHCVISRLVSEKVF
jgi:hypothetical protein